MYPESDAQRLDKTPVAYNALPAARFKKNPAEF